MWRALFLAIGVTLAIIGAECIVLEKAVLAARPPSGEEAQFFNQPISIRQGREIAPPEWAPWSFMSAGAVVILYSFTIPRRVSK